MAGTDTNTSQRKENETSLAGGIFGLVFLLLIGLGVYEGISALLAKLNGPPAAMALSAYFVDDAGNPIDEDKVANGHLKISGQVYQSGQVLKDGKVRLTVATVDQAFQQAVIIDIKDGRFETQDPAFNTLAPGDEIHITGEILSSGSSGTLEDLYLNTKPPKVTADTLWEIAIGIGIIVFAIFFYAFTGKRTPWKNRWAIIFSYCVIGFFLVTPLLAPVLFVSNDRRSTIIKPVGLVLTRTQDGKIQWALNIGGYATPTTGVQPSPGPSPTATASPTKTPVGSPTPLSTGTPANASPSPQPTSMPQPSATPAIQANAAGPSPTVSPGANAARTASTPFQQATPEASKENDYVVDVQGGLVIPLYIIILSVIGGAINMTRKVPQLQKEGEYADGAEGGLISMIPGVGRVARFFKKPLASKPGQQDQASSDSPNEQSGSTDPAAAPVVSATPKAEDKQESTPTAEDRAKEISSELGVLVEAQAKRRSDTESAITNIRSLVAELKKIFAAKKDEDRILDCNSFDDWMGRQTKLKDLLGSPWRVELLNQYMYLVSAPFLAIVAYYMLDLLGLTKQPILVLISFSVGLVSEKILSWLLGLASGYLRSDTSQSATTK